MAFDDGFNDYTKACFKDAPLPCQCTCPFKLDVAAFTGKIQRGNFNSAFRQYRASVVFPQIVSRICHEPCRAACVRSNNGEPVPLKEMEQACLRFSNEMKPVKYTPPPKTERIAIVGGGLSGLTCMLKLASRGYEVTLYEAADSIGGSLKGRLPAEVYEKEFALEFQNLKSHRIVLNHRITDLSQLEADAIYIATGKGGDDFGLRGTVDRNSLGTERPGVFLGGELLCRFPAEAIEQGSRASHSIEKYFKTGLMDGAPETYEEWPVNRNYCKRTLPPVPASGCETRETAMEEAARCKGCECSSCVDLCEMMEEFNRAPKKIAVDVTATLNPVQQLTKRIANRLINSCTLCGLCKEVCPEDVDMEACLLEARRLLHRDGAQPRAFHDFWIRDLEFTMSEEAFLSALPPGQNTCEYFFFPGCQLGASDPAYVLKAYEALLKNRPSTGIFTGCCGVPADWAGDEDLRDEVLHRFLREWEAMGKPLVIFACMTCKKTFGAYLPEVAGTTLYEVLADTLPFPESEGAGDRETLCVFDPCAGRHDEKAQAAVRQLLRRRGYPLEELDHHSQHAQCCGTGGHIYGANPKLAKEIAQKRIAEKEHPYVAYCANCRDVFAQEGKTCRHILDVMFDLNDGTRRAPGLSQRRENRRKLKAALAGQLLFDEAPERKEPSDSMILDIAPELREKMNEKLILDEDVKETISHCEATGIKIEDSETGNFIGHYQSGILTFWVVYRPEGDGKYRLIDVYSHRLQILEDE